MTKIKTVYRVARLAVKGWMSDGGTRLAAAVAFYTALSLAPLLTILISILSLFLGDEAARGLLLDEIEGVTDKQSAQFIQTMLSNGGDRSSSIVSSIFGGAILLWGATRLFYEIQEALDLIWNSNRSAQGFKLALKRRMLALGMCLVVAFLLLVSLALNTVLAFAVDSVRLDLPGEDWFWLAASSLASFAVVASLYMALYRWLPTAKVPWRSAVWGAVVSAALFSLGRDLFSIYLSQQNDIEGAARSLMVVLLWVYFSAQVFFFGAEVGKAVEEVSLAGTPKKMNPPDYKN